MRNDHATTDHILRLGVCKLIRSESRSIYYAETQFRLIIEKFNGAEFQPFMRQHQWFRHLVLSKKDSKTNIAMRMGGGANWENLVAWIKANHHGVELSPVPDTSGKVSGGLFGHMKKFYDAAFTLVEQMRWRPWTNIEVALNALRQGVEGMPSPWADGYDEDEWW